MNKGQTVKGGLDVNIPNALSILRILLTPLFAALYLRGQTGAAVAVLLLCALTDVLDGYIARRFDMVTELGKALDPVADKLTQITIAVMLYIAFRSCNDQLMVAFSWVFLVFLAKEAVMVIGGAIMIACGIKPGAAEIYGKVATFVFYLVMLVIIGFGPEIGAFRNYWTLPDPVLMVLVIISAILTIVAFASYMPATYRQVKEKHQSRMEAKGKK